MSGMQFLQQDKTKATPGSAEWRTERELLFARDNLQDAIKKYEAVSETYQKKAGDVESKRQAVEMFHGELTALLNASPKFQQDERFKRFL